MKKNIAIVMGGYSNEHDISIKSARVVQAHLNKEKFHVYLIHIHREQPENNGPTFEKWVYLDANNQEFPVDKSDFTINPKGEKIQFDCVFNAIHGTPGEDGLLQAYFELLGIPQTSCNHYQAALTFNKRDLLSA